MKGLDSIGSGVLCGHTVALVALVANLGLAAGCKADTAPVAAGGGVDSAAGSASAAISAPAGVALLRGTLRVARTGAETRELDVLGVYHSAKGHPRVVLETPAGQRLTLYEAPTTDRLMLSVDAAFVAASGVPAAAMAAPSEDAADTSYGSYLPLASLSSLTIEPPNALKTSPLSALAIRGLPVVRMSGSGSSTGDRPEDVLLRLDLDLKVTPETRDRRGPALVKLAVEGG